MIEGLFLMFCTGLAGGFTAGLLGIGCGVIITPLLIEFGVPPLMAIVTQLCHAVGTNLTNFLTYRREHDVDFRLAFYMLLGGLIGTICEWGILRIANDPKTIFNKFVYVYIVILLIIGCVMLYQSIGEWRGESTNYPKGVLMRRWMLYLPYHRIFVRSRAEMSIFIPIFLGFLAGLIISSLGGGTNLFMVPILTYLIGRISPVVNGTTALVGCVITSAVVLVYSATGYYCDITIVLILFSGAALGTWLGVKLSYRLKRYYVYMLATVTVFAMAIRQMIKLLNNSFVLNSALSDQFSMSSRVSDLIADNPLRYTIVCLIVVVTIAYIYEKTLQKVYDKSLNRKARRCKR